MFKETVKNIPSVDHFLLYSGNTHRIAQELQKITGGDWCEIHPWQPYPMAFPELLKQVKQEIRSRYHPASCPAPGRRSFIRLSSPDLRTGAEPSRRRWLPGCIRTICPENNSALLFSLRRGKGNFQGDIARLCPRADVREALGIINDNHQNLTAVLQNWLEKNGLMKDSFSYTAEALLRRWAI